MKKIIFTLLFSLLASGLISSTMLSASASTSTSTSISQESYVDCIRFASKEYEGKESTLLNTHRITIKSLELERSEQIKSHFTFFALRASITKIQTIRNYYRSKIDVADENLKNNLLDIKSDYEVRIELCQNKKKEMGDAHSL